MRIGKLDIEKEVEIREDMKLYKLVTLGVAEITKKGNSIRR